ncbi:hypothetical protein SSBR45G_00720 [Bradyrhizobium sp. SSBR45G]|uniref:hypothetical protein n=1 Tax=unclassified Bradyrhizobium TaxID=2631580 RepID=UPI002342A039|nr:MULTISPECIES: hypothetical protein [unclassified Bradyrhizobium]GLH75164.1 hypothetical protein SSBR45G_00720 [Bradyrhizobium sp. SSBR45G]GLH83049.1 hypothetical protein SSBR45R_05090 [Bradyrhizobium sp. SSBR45R]
MLATTTKDSDQQPHAVIDPEIVLAARGDRAAVDADRRSAQRPPDVPSPKIDPEFRTQATAGGDLAAAGGRTTLGTWVLRTVLAVLFAVGSAVAAAAWQSYGDQAQEVVAHWMPRISLVSNADKDGAQPAASSTQETAAAAASPAQEPATGALGAGASQEQAQLLQSMAHDLAALNQQITELKTSLAQLKSGQDQMAREMARVAEAKPSDRPSERTAEARPFDPQAIGQTISRQRPAPRPATAAVTPAQPGLPVPHRPRPPAPATAAMVPPPPAPMALPSAPAATDPDQPVVRPPMPVR